MGKRWRKYQLGDYTLQQLNGQACAVWRENGRRRRFRLGRAESESAARGLLAAFAATRATVAARSATTLAEVYAAYKADRIKDGKIARNLDDQWKPLEPTFGPLAPDAITADLCRAYASERLAAGLSQGSIWTELTRLRSCLNWAAKRRVIPFAPYVWLPQKPPPKDRVLTVDELRRLLDAAQAPHVRLFVQLAIGTGARSGALFDLTWERVDLDAGIVDLKSEAARNPLSKAARKHRAVVQIAGHLKAALAEARTGALSDHVIEWDGQPIKCIRKGFQEACRRAKLSGVTPHTLRHTCASWAVSDGQEMERVARFLGHRDVATTRAIYAHTGADYVAPVAEAVALRLVKGGA